MKIGIVGAGNVGGALGRGWEESDHEVVYAGRGSVRKAAQADVIVLATPGAAVPDVLRELGDLEGRVLVDATNGFGAEKIVPLAPGAHLVKAFNTTGWENMADPRYGEEAAAMFVCGDDTVAKQIVVELAGDLGFNAIALGGIAQARWLEALAGLWISMWRATGSRSFAFGLLYGPSYLADATGVAAPQRRKITIVGAGRIGGRLAKAFASASHEVTIAERDGIAAATKGADVIVLAVPYPALGEVTRAIGDASGKIVITAMNAIGGGPREGSCAEEVAAFLPGAKVVESFNQQGAECLEKPLFGRLPATNFLAGDDPTARRVAAELTRVVGLEPVEAGPLTTSRQLEALTMIWLAASNSLGRRDLGWKLLRR